jgi:hypothetical protein
MTTAVLVMMLQIWSLFLYSVVCCSVVALRSFFILSSCIVPRTLSTIPCFRSDLHVLLFVHALDLCILVLYTVIQYNKIKPVRRRHDGRCGFRPPSFWNSVKKNQKMFEKKSILKPVVVCWCAVYISENRMRRAVASCVVVHRPTNTNIITNINI